MSSANHTFLSWVQPGASASLPDSRPEIDVKLVFAAAAPGESRFAGAKVPRRALQEIVQGPVGFLKIDVDGGEMSLLAGAAPLIEA